MMDKYWMSQIQIPEVIMLLILENDGLRSTRWRYLGYSQTDMLPVNKHLKLFYEKLEAESAKRNI